MAGVLLLAFITVVFFSRFRFTKVFSGTASQDHVYNESVHELVQDFIRGQNCLLFAYGTSSAGKTYTIQGMLLLFL
jgi:Kinesin-like protein